jgi:flagellar basal-body rod protein FlgB
MLKIGIADTSDMAVTPSHFGTLWQLLDATGLRHQVISQNVANVNTPGYHRMEVAFEQQFAEQLQQGKLDFNGIHPEVYEVEGLTERADGNNVDIDKEMGQLNKNALLYQTYGQVLASKLAMMRSAITGQ